MPITKRRNATPTSPKRSNRKKSTTIMNKKNNGKEFHGLVLTSAQLLEYPDLVAVDGNLYDYVDVEYILKNANGRRKGTISVSIDATGNTSTLNDSFTTSVVPTSTDLDNSFTGVVAGGTFNLQYTATNSADISYVLTNWKSS